MKKNYPLLLAATIAIIFCLAGCKKESVPVTGNSLAGKISKTNTTDDPLVATPGGWLPKSHVFLVEAGFHLDVSSGHVLKVEDETGKIMADFGEIHKNTGAPKNSGHSSITRDFNNFTTSLAVGQPDGWMAYSQWWSYPDPITYFSSTWTVPGAPSTNHGQLIYIFNALSAGSDILQPVLQWGSSPAGGGSYWAVANWYGWDNNVYFAFTVPIQVNAGNSLLGIISNTSTRTDGSLNFSVGFNGYPNALNVVEGANYSGTINKNNATVTIPFIDPQTYGYETIEAYNSEDYDGGLGVARSSDYPAQANVQMKSITLYTNGSPAALTWTPYDGYWANFGEHANIISNNSSGTGQVNLYFHAQPPVFSYNTPNVFTQGVQINSLFPNIIGSKSASYSVSPVLPSNLILDSSTGIISGWPVVSSPQTTYTVTGTNSAGSGHTTITIKVNGSPTGSYTFGVVTTKAPPGNVTDFDIVVNGENISGPRGTAPQNQVNNVTNTGVILLSNSTVVMEVTSGYMPVSAFLSGPFGTVNGVISGNNITFSNVNLSFGNSCGLTIN